MSDFIPDTSVSMAWCFEDEANPYSEALLARLEADEEALVPSLWPLEVANALVKAKQRGRVTESHIVGFLEDLLDFAIRIVQTLSGRFQKCDSWPTNTNLARTMQPIWSWR